MKRVLRTTLAGAIILGATGLFAAPPRHHREVRKQPIVQPHRPAVRHHRPAGRPQRPAPAPAVRIEHHRPNEGVMLAAGILNVISAGLRLFEPETTVVYQTPAPQQQVEVIVNNY